MWLALVFACAGDDEPAVRAVRPPPPTVEEVAAKREAEAIRASPRNLEVNYVKPEGVYVDAHFFGGRRWENVRDIVVEQLGATVEESTDAQGRTVRRFERGTLTLADDGDIEEIEVPLPEPMRRADAMVACGFSGLADRYLSFTYEYRVTQFQGFRRIVLHRVAKKDDMVDRVTAQHRQERMRELR